MMNQMELEKGKPVAVLADPSTIDPVFAGKKKTMVLFEMTACPYCRMFEGRFLDFALERAVDFDFVRVTLDDPGNPLWSRYDIHVVPQIIIFAGGRIVSRLDSIPFVGITKKNWADFSGNF